MAIRSRTPLLILMALASLLSGCESGTSLNRVSSSTVSGGTGDLRFRDRPGIPKVWKSVTPAAAWSSTVRGSSSPQELLLKFNYSVTCVNGNISDFPGITGEVAYSGRKIRVELFKFNTSTEISLSTSPSSDLPISLTLDSSANCTLRNLQAWVAPMESNLSVYESAAIRYAPFLVVDDWQYGDKIGSLPLQVQYLVFPNPDGTAAIHYRYYSSNEHTEGLFTTSHETAMGSYGRRTETKELLYINVDAQGKLTGVSYHGGQLGSVGHQVWPFKGTFLENSQHAILYLTGHHNVASDQPSGVQLQQGMVGHHLVPRTVMDYGTQPSALWFFQNPWSLHVSDAEMFRLKKTTHLVTDYFFVGIQAPAVGNDVRMQIKLGGKSFIAAGDYDTDGAPQGYSAIQVGSTLMQQIGTSAVLNGEVSFLEDSSNARSFDPKNIKVFRINLDNGLYSVEELTNLFSCRYAGLGTTCSFDNQHPNGVLPIKVPKFRPPVTWPIDPGLLR